MFIETIIATVIISLISLVGVTVFAREHSHDRLLRLIVPVAVGVFLGVVFFELIPETLEASSELGNFAIAGGFIGFYLLSLLLHTYHHHHQDESHSDDCDNDKASASMLLVGDTIHNFADGIVIATAFLLNPAVGVATTIGIALHEIPQEIAEFSVLLRAGYSKSKAALYNLASATSVILGAIITLVFAAKLEEYIWILTGLAAGNLLYIAASDLLPDVHEESRSSGKIWSSFIATLIGLVGITLLLSWVHENFEHHDHASETEHSPELHVKDHHDTHHSDQD